MVKLVNRAKMTTSTNGQGTITLGSASDGYQTFADAGVSDGDQVRYTIEDGNAWEIGTGTYTASGTTLSRTVSESSNSNNKLNLSGNAVVFVTAIADDVGVKTYSTTSAMAASTTGSKGSLAFVEANHSFYINNGNGWYRIGGAAVNTTPTFTYSAGGGTTPANNSSTSLATDQSATTVTLSSTDADEGTTVTYSHSVTTGSLNGTTVSQNNNVFTITPHASNTTSFTLTYSATDGINTATSTHNFSLNFPAPYGDRGLGAGGYSAALGGHNQTQIDYFDISGTASVTVSDFGDLDVGRGYAHGVSSGDRVVFAASRANDLTGDDRKQMDYIAPATTGNASNFGDYGEIRETYGAGSNGARGIFLGNAPSYSNEMRQITIDTLGNASDYADLDTARRNAGAAYNDTYMLVAGGMVSGGSVTADIDRVTIATTSNATDYGDLTQARYNPVGAADSSRAVFMGGYGVSAGTNTMDYINMGSSGSTNSATNFGNLSSPVPCWAGISNGTRGCALYASDIWMITIQTEANSSTLGTLLASRSSAGGASGFDA
jgi:hypothetical protein